MVFLELQAKYKIGQQVVFDFRTNGTIIAIRKKYVQLQNRGIVLFAKTYIVRSNKDNSTKEIYQPDIELI